MLPWVDLAIGAGLAADGPQVAGTLRVHQRKSGWRMFGAASVSQGDWIDGGINKTRHLFDGARWVSAELGAENGQRGVFTRWGVGFTKLVSYDACHDEDYPGDPAARVNPCRDPLQRSYLLPFLSITLGYRY